MIDAWRVTKEKYAESAFSGEGARLAGGRFNSPGRAVVYASSSLALAELEILVNLPTDHLLGSYVAFKAQLPADLIDALPPEDLPENWREDPAPRTVKELGDAWLKADGNLALKVPSAVVPSEHNYLLRPRHPAFGEFTLTGPFDPEIDPRLR